jgi:hypothetical protein
MSVMLGPLVNLEDLEVQFERLIDQVVRATLISQIEILFADKGWQPLLPVKLNGPRSLSIENLRSVSSKVLAASDRVAAVTLIVEAVMPVSEAAPETPCDLSDSAELRLRLPK